MPVDHDSALHVAPIVLAMLVGLALLLIYRLRTLRRNVRHQSETLRETEERFRHLFQDTVQPISIIEDGRFVAANPASLAMLGYAHPEELLGRSPGDISPAVQPDGQPSASKAATIIGNAFATGSCRFEWQHLRADGTPFLADVILTATRRGGKNVLHVVWNDITAQKETERQLADYRATLEDRVAARTAELDAMATSLRIANEEQQAIFDTATSGLALIKNRIFIRGNRKLHEMFGWPPGTLIGKPTAIWYADAVAHAAGGDPVYEAIWQGHSHCREQELMRKDGSLFWARLTGNAVDMHDHEKGTVWVIDDVTAERAAFAAMRHARALAEDATRLKAEFVANMSHEIRTPMNIIIGMTHVLQKTPLSEPQLEHLTKIQGASQQLLGMINGILDFSRLEAGKMHIEHIDFELQQIFDKLMSLCGERAAAKGLTLHFSAGPGVPQHLAGDPARISQVLLSYVDNALKFTEQGRINIRANLSTSDNEHITLRFEVTDTGIGIADADRTRLFKTFEQADGSHTRKYGGTGLGLAISQRLAALMGGKVGVSSTPGKGSTFWFTARLGRSAAPEREPAHASLPPAIDPAADFEVARFESVCDQLAQQLANDEFGCTQLLGDNATLLQTGLGGHYEWIVEAVNTFNFSAALDWLEEARAQRDTHA